MSRDDTKNVESVALVMCPACFADCKPEQRWPAGLLDRIKAAEQRVQDNRAPRSIPANPHSDVDLVLAEVRYLIEGKWPPFWIKDAAELPRGELTEQQWREAEAEASGEPPNCPDGSHEWEPCPNTLPPSMICRKCFAGWTPPTHGVPERLTSPSGKESPMTEKLNPAVDDACIAPTQQEGPVWEPLPYSTTGELIAAFLRGKKFVLHYHDRTFIVTHMDAREKVVYVRPPALPVKVFPNGRSAEGTSSAIWLGSLSSPNPLESTP